MLSGGGDDVQQQAMFSYLSPEVRVPKDHPLRPIRKMVNRALAELSGEFQAMYSREGRPSIAPEKLLRTLLLQVLYTIRSERLLMEQLDYNLLFRWFVGLSMDDKVWDHSVFSKNPGYAISQRLRKRVEEIFGWIKTVGNLRKTRHRGTERVGWMFTFTAAAYNLVRIRNLTAAVSP
jgi:hypothetical protein